MKIPKRKLAIIVFAFPLAFALGFTFAQTIATYSMPQTATGPQPTPSPTPSPVLSASFTIDGNPWTSGSAISWGTVAAGANTKTVVITNTGNVPITSVSISVTGGSLPATWTETLTSPSTPLQPGQSTTETLTLTADYSAPTLQSWTSTITITG